MAWSVRWCRLDVAGMSPIDDFVPAIVSDARLQSEAFRPIFSDQRQDLAPVKFNLRQSLFNSRLNWYRYRDRRSTYY